MNRKSNRIDKPVLIFLALLFFVIFVLSSLTPMADDDYSYCFSFYDDSRIISPMQIIPSMAVHRQLLNGRVIVHGIVQFILMFPKVVFNSLNGFNAVLLFLLFSRYLNGSSNRKVASLSCGAMALWSFLPDFGANFLWLDGAINYAWGYSIFFLFIWPYSANYLGFRTTKTSLINLFAFLVLSFVAGSYSENASFVFFFLGASLSLLIWRRDHHISCTLLLGLAAELCGWIYLITAPGSSHRSAEMKLSVIGNNLANLIKGMESYLFWLVLIDIILLLVVIHFHGRKEIIILSSLFLCGSIGGLLAFSFAAYFVPRHYCCTCVLLIFVLVILSNEAFCLKQQLLCKMLIGCLAVLFIFRFSLGLLDIAVCWHKAQVREQTIFAAVENGETSVTVENCVPMTKYALQFYLNDDKPSEWPNIAVSSYYGIKEIYGVEPKGQ